MTEGLSVTLCSVKGKKLTLVVQDCGGQALYHYMHGLLVGHKRAVHVVVLNPLERLGDPDYDRSATQQQAEYWLRLVASKAVGTRVLVVFTHEDVAKDRGLEAVILSKINALWTDLKSTFSSHLDLVGMRWVDGYQPDQVLFQQLVELAEDALDQAPVQIRGDIDIAGAIREKYHKARGYEHSVPFSTACQVLRDCHPEVIPTAELASLVFQEAFSPLLRALLLL